MSLNRRTFLKSSAAAAALSPLALRAAESPNEKIVVAVVGTNGRGSSLAGSFAALPGAEVAYICDPDSRAQEKGAKVVSDKSGKAPKTLADFRKALEDKSLDAIVVATPDHWHAPATILGCSAEKHVYCEKPASHNAREGELMVEAARKHKRVVQLGTQRRSMTGIKEGIEKLHAGVIGKVTFCRTWYNNARGSIGTGKTAEVPSWLDYSLWQGPAPEQPYRNNILHYNWHWFWNWGTSELGNNGIHALDVGRWGINKDYPKRVTCTGGRYYYQDDQQTPDTAIATYVFDDCTMVWEGHSCHRRGFENSGFGVAFYGTKGAMVVTGDNYTVYDPKGKELEKGSGSGGDRDHIQNFLDCIKSGGRPNADIEIGVKSTLLCHLGNIAYRSGQVVNCDPKTGRLTGNEQQQQFWGREYRSGWEPKV